MGKYVDYYCKNNNKRLKQEVDNVIIKNFGWLPQKEQHDFYSLAGQVVWNCEQNFIKDKNAKFITYLTSCLLKKFKSRITYCNRDKRKLKDENGRPIPEISINALIDGESDVKIENFLISDVDVFKSILSIDESMNDEIQKYIAALITSLAP